MISPNLSWDSYGISRNPFRYLLLILLFSISFNSYSQLAFPTAEGFGKNATGGRGGAVIKVTNLNDSGAGSLRQALQYTSGPRTIVFEVGGTITLNSALGVSNGDVTVAGQTAPGDGILIRGSMVIVEKSNVILRYIRFRPGLSAPDNESDGLSITAWGNNLVEDIIIDHCSMSWSKDENFNIRVSGGNGTVRNITLQNSIISEATYGVLSGGKTHSITYYNNMFAHNQERNIVHNYPDNTNLSFEMINNLIYGCLNGTQVSFGGKYTVINNEYKKSSQQNLNPNVVDGTTAGQGTPSNTYAYLENNIVPNGTNPVSTGLIQYLETTPFANSGIVPIPTNQVADNMISHVGASLPNRDAVDIRLINQYNSNTGSIATSGVYPTILGGTAPTDTDDDGMPDTWEIENGLNINDASDRNIVQADGYTNLEYFLNGMTLETQGNQVIITSQDEDETLCEGESTILTASEADSFLWNTGETTSSLEITPDVTTTYTATGTHSDGSTTEAEITITINQIPIANAGEDTETCLGTPVTLTASGGTSYLWSNGATTASTTINPNSTATLTVEVFENTCSSIDEVTVTVNEIPDVDAGEDQTIFEGQSATLTATGADTYLWSTGETTQSIIVNPILDTSYAVTGTSNTCENTDSVTIFLLDDGVNANAGADTEICIGESTTLTATGGTTYLWSTGQTTASIEVSPTEITTYTVTAYSASGANFEDDSVIVTVNELPIANAGDDVTICFGNSTTLTASGGTTYLWNTGETTQTITINPTETTTYTVEVYENDCSSTDDISVTVNDLPETNAGDDVSIIEGDSTTLIASGADSYLWSTGETTSSILVSPTSTTTYTVTGNSNGCESIDDVIVSIISDDVTANAGEDSTICIGESTTLTASGGTTYLWSTGETTASIEVSPTTTTTYTVTAYSPSGTNFEDDSVIVTVNELPIANAGDDVAICFGNSTTLTASGGSTYIWSTGETTQTITVNPNNTTTYTVEVFENNCSSIDQTQVTVNALPETDAGSNVSITEGESATLTVSGADSYLWSTGETTSSIIVSPESTSTYSVIGTNSNGCEFGDSVIVFVGSAAINANAGADVTICFGNSTTLTASGGSTYLWNTGETTASITVNPNQTTVYTVTAYNETETVSDNDSVSVTVNALPETNAGPNVSIIEGESTTLTASGADSYVWSTGETTPSIIVSPASTTTYSVIGTNSNGCEFSDSVIVSVGTENVTANAGNDVAICFGNSTTLTASGGSTYLWNTGETTASITVNPNQTTVYTVTAFNEAETASDDDSVSVTVNALPETNAGPNVSIIEGESTTLTASGADSYVWSTGETTPIILVSPTSTTTYSVIGTNANGCNFSDNVIVSVETESITANAGADVVICNGETTTLTASGGASYLWSTGQTTSIINVSPTSTTSYTVTAFNTNGSESNDDSVTVTVNEIPVADAGNDVTICFGNVTNLSASGGETYLWSTGQTTQNITVNPNSTTTYVVEVFTNGCSSVDDIVVTVNDLPQTYAGIDITIDEGDSTTLTATGAVSYVWNTGETTSSILVNPMVTTTYSVTGTSNGCESVDDVIVTVEPFVYTASAGANQTICQGYETTLTASEGDSYLWSTGETTQSITVNPTNTQTYTVTVFEGDYQADAEVQVGVNPNPNVVITNGNDVMILEGEFITLSASGANSYSWNNGATQPNIAVSPSITTTYEVTGFINNCEDTTAILVNVLEIVEADAGEDIIICDEETVTLTATGGDEYLWNNGETTQSIEVSPDVDTEYSVLVYNALDSDEDTVMVFVEACSTIENPTESDEFGFLIYQDPTTDILKVRIDGLQSVTATGFSIYSLRGKAIYTETFNQADMQDLSQMTRELDVSTYSRGIYIVRLMYDDTSIIKKTAIK